MDRHSSSTLSWVRFTYRVPCDVPLFHGLREICECTGRGTVQARVRRTVHIQRDNPRLRHEVQSLGATACVELQPQGMRVGEVRVEPPVEDIHGCVSESSVEVAALHHHHCGDVHEISAREVARRCSERGLGARLPAAVFRLAHGLRIDILATGRWVRNCGARGGGRGRARDAAEEESEKDCSFHFGSAAVCGSAVWQGRAFREVQPTTTQGTRYGRDSFLAIKSLCN